jgi:hypothetical protein
MPDDEVMEVLRKHQGWLHEKPDIVRLIISLRTAPSDEVMTDLQTILTVRIPEIYEEHDVLKLMLITGKVPFDNTFDNDILKGLRKPNVAGVILKYHLRIFISFLSFLSVNVEKVKVILKYHMDVSDDILRELGKRKNDDLVFQIPEILLSAILTMGKIPDDGILETLKGLPENHLIFQMPEVLLIAVLKIGKIPSDDILRELKKEKNRWLLERSETLLRAILNIGKIPDDGILKTLKGLPENHLIFQMPEVLLRMLLLGKVALGDSILKEFENVSAEHGIFEREAAVEAILARKKMPTGNVLDGLAELPKDHPIFETPKLLGIVLDREFMPNEAMLKVLGIPEVLKAIHDCGKMPSDNLLQGLGINDWITTKSETFLKAILIFGRLPSDSMLKELKDLPNPNEHIPGERLPVIFTKPVNFLIAIFKIGKIPGKDILLELEKEENCWLLEMPEILLRAILIMGKIPVKRLPVPGERPPVPDERPPVPDEPLPVPGEPLPVPGEPLPVPGGGILEALKVLPTDHIVFAKSVSFLIAILETGKIPNKTLLQKLKDKKTDDVIFQIKNIAALKGLIGMEESKIPADKGKFNTLLRKLIRTQQ